MYKIQFWKSWPRIYQQLLLVTVMVFVTALAAAFIPFALNPAPVYGWAQLQELQQQQIPVHTFGVGGFDFTVFAENNIIFERWTTTPLQLSMTSLDLYLVLFSLGMVVLFSVITVLPRFWFFACAGIAVFMISTFQLETLRIFGLINRVPTIGMMVVLLGITLYYQYLKTAASFLQRTLVFLAAVIGLGFLIGQFSEEPMPLRYFAISTLPAAIILMIVFIIMVAHEIMAGFVSLVGQGTRNSKSLQHYLIISSIYLLNLWIAYWNRIGWIDWGMVIHPVLLLGASGILAIWGIRQRQPQYEQIVSADPFGVYFIIAMGTITFGLVGYFIATSTDVSLLSLNEIIIYTHLGYGMMFLMYVASNFLGMLSANFPVYKVLYKPTVMPYFSYRMAGLIFTLAFVFYNSWMVPVNHFISGYYTSLGDLYLEEGQTVLAMGYYKRANFYAPYNQHAATALAEMEQLRGNQTKERSYLKNANSYKPTEFTLIHSADSYTSNKLEEILMLQEAQRILPGSGVIKNNLGIAYARLGLVDSAYQFLSRAGNDELTRASAQMNQLGLMAQYDSKANPDSIFQVIGSEQPRVSSNILAMANHQGRQINVPIELPKDSILNLFSASLIGNFIINQIAQPDTAFLSRCVALTHDARNRNYKETILIPVSLAFYANGQVKRAFQLLQEVVTSGSNKAELQTTLGLWALELGNPETAAYYFKFGMNQNSRQAAVAHAVATAEMGNLNNSLIAWDTLGNRSDSSLRSLAESMKRVLAAPPAWYIDLTDKEKYLYVHYRVPLEDSVQFNRTVDQIRNADMKARAILDRSNKWFSNDEIEMSTRLYKKLQGLEIADPKLFTEIQYFELRLLAAHRQWNTLRQQMEKGPSFGPYHETERIYYEALRQVESGDSVNAARNFRWIASNNYYFDEGIVSASEFFRRSRVSEKEIYTNLAEALLVNPKSVKILKAYILSAAERGFDDYAYSALTRLQPLISRTAFQKFISKNQLSGLNLQ